MNFITEQLDVLIKFIQKNLIRQEQSFNHFERYLILRSHSYWKSNFSKTSNFSSTISRYLSEEEDKFRDGRKIVNQRKKARRKRPIGRTVFPSSRPPFAFFSLLSPLFLFWFFTQLSSDSNPIEPRRDARSSEEEAAEGRIRRRESCMNNWFPGREWKQRRTVFAPVIQPIAGSSTE